MATQISSPAIAGRSRWTSPWTMFWIGLAIRVIYITCVRPYTFRGAYEHHFEFGWEMGRIATALAEGHGYADPFVPGTGPTAWTPPLYPLLLAGVFKLFGVYSLLSGWVILVINSIFNCAIIPAIYEIAVRCYNRRVALWSAWIWTLYPAAMQYAVRWVWEMSLTCMLFTWMIVVALRLRGVGDGTFANASAAPNRTRLWAIFGLLWGAVALSNASLLLSLPAAGLWILWRRVDLGKEIARATLAGLLFIACLAPWTYRNFVAFHKFIPIRGNLGAEMWAASGPDSTGYPYGNILPLVPGAPLIELYRHMGEAQYVKMRGDMANAYIRTHRRHFALISLKRFYFIWAGVPHALSRHEWQEYFREFNFCVLSLTGIFGVLLSLRRRVPGAVLFGWIFLLAPLTYYFVTPGARFRHPLEPIIAIVTVYLFQSASPRRPAV